MPRDWSDNEVSAIVTDYFDMLEIELRGESYNKAEHNRQLAQILNSRSSGSIEYKHENISAALLDLGMPYIPGYKPLKNYQHALLEEIIQYLTRRPEIRELISNDVESIADIPTVEEILDALVPPPTPRSKRIGLSAEPRASYIHRSINYLEREAANHSLGNAGERFILNFEHARLISIGKEYLADRIQHISVEEGDWVGYDIHSYDANGNDRFIEAKTTRYGEETPFFVSANELRFSDQHRNNYHLYRVFNFRRNPRLFTLPGYLEQHCRISPIEYMANF